MFEIQIWRIQSKASDKKKTNELNDRAWHVHWIYIYVNVLTKLFVWLSFQRISVLYVEFFVSCEIKEGEWKK